MHIHSSTAVLPPPPTANRPPQHTLQVGTTSHTSLLTTEFARPFSQVGSAGYSIKLNEQERLRMVFSFLPFKGRVRLKKPQHLFQVPRSCFVCLPFCLPACLPRCALFCYSSAVRLFVTPTANQKRYKTQPSNCQVRSVYRTVRAFQTPPLAIFFSFFIF